MKINIINTGFIISLCIILLVSCKKDNDIEKSVFIYDTDENGLPQYSEWGYNTFGAYYDRNVFISNDYELPVKVIVNNNSTSIRLQGQLNGSDYYSNNEMTLTFKINGYNPEQYTDLIALNDSIIDLKDDRIEVIITRDDAATFVAEIISGELYFKRIQNLVVDEEQIEIIASGYFNLQALINNEPITISDGRFDLGINTGNFYNY